MEAKTLFVGFDGQKVVDTKTTREQIEAVKALECALVHEGEAMAWEMLDNPAETRTLFQFILADRKRRVDEHTMMADRPPIAVVTAVDNQAVRLEFYEGHDALTCTYDFRSKELAGKDLPRWMGQDPMTYDPAKFLKETLGFDENFARAAMKALHPDTWEEEHPEWK